ncbi:MAG: hypothetical protein A2Z88_04330 [Omnitrophica WOR_2 bacterium GWA2_47_8]|nr:MAG: hypothetical protein A2Z88_04330 [Omnitrophica WOR_2 bacterium GWA2_47_8]
MPEPQERHYNIEKLNRLFAIASLVLLAALVLMFADDYSRKWKDYQKEFRQLEIEKTRVKFDKESNRLIKDEAYVKLEGDIAEAQKVFNAQCSQFAELDKKLKKSQAEDELLKHRLKIARAELDAARFGYEEALHPAEAGPKNTAVEALKQRFDGLTQQVKKLSKDSEALESRILEESRPVTECGKGLAELDRKKKALEMQSFILQRKLKKIDPGEMSPANLTAEFVRDLPVIDFANPNYKIEQIVLKDLTDDVNFMQVPKVDRCTTCHLGINNPDYKNAPHPYRTHPQLELFVGNESAHPLEDFGCTVCHQGRGRGTDFTSAVHTPSSEEQRKEWEKKYGWQEYHHWETPMYPMPYVEAGCFKCHSGESPIKGAKKLSLGLNVIERAGCYSCHAIDKYKNWPKPGPDLTHITAKLDKDWVYRWISDPKSFRHNTWMPSFYNQSNNSDPQSIKRGQQEIHAMVHYLFNQGKEFQLDGVPSTGDAQKGEAIIASAGCFACHKIDPSPTGEKTTRQTLMKEQGPSLIGLGSKTNKEWIYNWLKDPHRYHPQTRMPNLRLSDQEAADAAAYLAKDKNSEFMSKPIPAVDEAMIATIGREFLLKSETEAQANAKLFKMNLDDKLNFAGEKLVAHYGCYSCHDINGFELAKPIGTDLTEEGSKPTDKLDFGFSNIERSNHAWFTQKLKDPRIFDQGKIKTADEKLRMPNFDLSAEEIEAVTTAILGFVSDKPGDSKLKPKTSRNKYIEEGQEVIRQFNCQACHLIDGEGGGIQSSVADWLVKYNDMTEGDATAVVTSFSPPNLIGEGKKVQAQWLFEFLHEPTTIRPWLKVRMPTYKFNVVHLNALLRYFSALDDQEIPFSELIDIKTTAEELAAGQKLFSNDYFGCAKCHIVGDQMPGGSAENWAPDFALIKKRLKPKWLKEWIKDPQVLLPGTKMPNFYDPQSFDQSGPEDILNGDENAQIEALKNYLMTLTTAPTEAPKPEKSLKGSKEEPATAAGAVSTPPSSEESSRTEKPKGP